MSSSDFSDQTAIVTGGTRGIGGAIAAAFLEHGARVIATYSRNCEAAEGFAAEHREAAARLELHRFDVADYAEVEGFFRALESRGRVVDILVNSAGVRRDGVVGMLSRDDWQRVIDVNLTGAYNMSKFAVLNMLPARYGRIVNITSPSAKLGFEGQANYAASKAGLVAFTRSLSKEVARRGITANCVSPGFVETDFISSLPPERLKVFRELVPMKRFGTPAEIAQAVLFLASKAAAYITGATLDVTGGL